MKYSILKFFTLTLLLTILTSCDNFLAEDPRSLVAPEVFFNSDQEAKSAVVGLYDIYKNNSLWGKVGLDRYYENGADTIGPNRVFGQVTPTQAYTLGEGNISDISQGGGAPLTWQDLYRIIVNSNLIIDRIQDNENISPAGRDQFLGEVLYLRSEAYYHLTNLWGDVPYFREDLTIEEVRALGRTDKNLIRNDIIDDLEQAQNLLPDSYSGNDLGRASRWAAATLLVKVHLWQENWQDARDKAVEIINNSPHRLLDNYADIFDPANEYNDENIYELDFVKDLNSNGFTDHFTPRIRDEPLNSDQRPALEDSLSAINYGMTGFGLSIPLPDLVNNFPVDDLRRESNIIESMFGIELTFEYMPKLWNLDQINSPRGNHGENRIIFRLADVYLMAAEAENELNGPADAYQYINEVRKRAYDPEQPLSGLTQQQFREAIYDERKWELAGENHRRMDLIRWGILLDVVKQTEYRVYNPAENIQPRHVLLPIPVEELRLNPALLESDPTNNGYR